MFFNESNKENGLAKIAALLIYTAKIDQNFSEKEEEIIQKTLLEIGADKENIKIIIDEGKKIESNSNQILEFTQKVKNMDESDKLKIIECLWKIIYC